MADLDPWYAVILTQILYWRRRKTKLQIFNLFYFWYFIHKFHFIYWDKSYKNNFIDYIKIQYISNTRRHVKNFLNVVLKILTVGCWRELYHVNDFTHWRITWSCFTCFTYSFIFPKTKSLLKLWLSTKKLWLCFSKLHM